MKKSFQCVVSGVLLALAFAASAADEGEGLWKDIPAWAYGTFSGKAEGRLSTTGQVESVWVDENPTARVSMKVSNVGELSGSLTIGERTFVVSSKGIVAPDPEDEFFDIVEFSEPTVSWNGVPATNIVLEMENMMDDFSWIREDPDGLPRSCIRLEFSIGGDVYEVDVFREFETDKIPTAIKALEGRWAYGGDNTNKWRISVNDRGEATLYGETNDGYAFKPVESKIIDYGLDTMPDCFSDYGAYFNVPATEDHEGVNIWMGFDPDDHSGDYVNAYVAIRDVLTVVNADIGEVEIFQPEGPDSNLVIFASGGKNVLELAIPSDIKPENVTLVAPPDAVVKLNGANVQVANKIAGETHFITSLIHIPQEDEDGWIDLAAALVKEEYAKEVLDPEKGAVVDLNAANPVVKTAPTRGGLVYTFNEGETLDGMNAVGSKVGDGEQWTPEIKVKGGNSAFYSIGVGIGQ